MASEVDNKRKSRRVLRSSFTRLANELEVLLNVGEPNINSIKVSWELLEAKRGELMVLDNSVYDLILEKATEEELESEIEGHDVYLKKFATLRVKYEQLIEDGATEKSGRNNMSLRAHSSNNIEATGKRKFKLPTIEFKRYDGSIQGWLSFWAQFKKIHEDNSIDEHDKIEYLIQATVVGSKARQLVESYPAMGENYQKIIHSMHSRFGREDLQIEVYVRSLLKLVLTNTASQQKVDMANLYDQLETQLRALETLGITSEKCSAMLYPLIESCLPQDLIRVCQRSASFNSCEPGETEDECSINTLEIRLKKLMLFLKHEVENEQRITMAVEGFGLAERKAHTKDTKRDVNVSTATGFMNHEAAGCVFCAGFHDSSLCFKAQKMTIDQKRDALSKKKACFKCLKVGHHTKKCKNKLRCVVCGYSHTPLMCPEIPANKTHRKSPDEYSNIAPKEAVNNQVLANNTGTHIFLQTLLVALKGVRGSKVVRALIDTGSQRSYVLRETAAQLGYRPKSHQKVIHCLFGGKELSDTHSSYDVTICEGEYSFTFEALDQQTICGHIAPIPHGSWMKELDVLGIQISDIRQHGPIELLLGADIAGSLYTGDRRELPCGLFAIETHVGWTLMGKIPDKNKRSDAVITTLNLFVREASISDLWELEALGIKEPSDRYSKEESAMAAKELFLQTVCTKPDGRYEVRLPWLEDHPPLPTNYKLAQKRLSGAIRKLKGDQLFEKYDQVFHEWESEGIIEQLGKSDRVDVSQGYYLPHRPVIKENSTTKIRPVYDASAHEKDKPSLNHCLEKGMNLIELIPSMLLRFRENKIGVISDIKKAFLQISINEKDCDYVRFLWVDAEGHETVFRHKRVVFGLNSSPFLLGATLEYHLTQCARKCSENTFSLDTIERLRRSFYVDNCVTSLSDEKSVTKFIRESVAIMAQGRFELRGWERTRKDDSNVDDLCSVLGLNWCPKEDVLTLNQKFLETDLNTEDMIVTKRLILSLTQKVFDPIGYLCPATLMPKLILQKLWKEELKWDQPVDDATACHFKRWVDDIHSLLEIKIPRWILSDDDGSQDPSLHTFCDASKEAYAAVVYLRIRRNGKINVFLLAAKARVAPLRKNSSKMTIPRLELLAATIGARLYAHVVENLGQKIDSFFWSDSSTVISWIQRQEEWGIFVWNRVAEIRKLTPLEKWSYLPGLLNPADLPSRGCSPKHLLKSRWWEGPSWLYGDLTAWPSERTMYDEEEISAERKKKLVSTLLNVNHNDIWNLNHFSKYNKTVRMVAWILRFIHNCRYPDDKHKYELTVEEHEVAEKFIFKLIQKEFSGEGAKRIIGLAPFYDKDGVIRLKSRVSSRRDSEYYRLPVILPAKHPLVTRLIMDVHVKSCHVGTQGLLSLLREKFWMLGGRRAIRSVITKCAICRRYDGKALFVNSPPLPLDRVRDAIAFEVSGVDFAGPLYLKNGNKAWVCVFTCAVFRAIHLELTTSLSTSSFLQALRRFVSRRGRPTVIYSDNGTNFLGAENALDTLDWDTITRETSIQRISWRFNPPTAAWWGGFWERLIGVLKRLLRKVLGRACLDYEDLLTVLCECEAIVNARPLTYLSEDPKDLVALSPAMFLRDLVECGLPDIDSIDRASLCQKARRIQSLRENLRSRFRAEYLGQLKLLNAPKTEWQIAVGDLVIVGDDNHKRLDWPVGRVIEVFPGKDNRVRLVRVKTARGQLLRPLQRLYLLECCDGSAIESGKVKDISIDAQESDLPSSDFAREQPGTASVGASTERMTRSGRLSKLPRRFL